MSCLFQLPKVCKWTRWSLCNKSQTQGGRTLERILFQEQKHIGSLLILELNCPARVRKSVSKKGPGGQGPSPGPRASVRGDGQRRLAQVTPLSGRWCQPRGELRTGCNLPSPQSRVPLVPVSCREAPWLAFGRRAENSPRPRGCAEYPLAATSEKWFSYQKFQITYPGQRGHSVFSQ